jgi:extracellular factor (EF) 3-hydroxypalmitic acid methyl ester biosynthesis protein
MTRRRVPTGIVSRVSHDVSSAAHQVQVSSIEPRSPFDSDRRRTAALRSLSHVVMAFERLDQASPRLSPSARLHRGIAATHRICAASERCEAAGVTEGAIRAMLAPVRAIYGRSPLIARLQKWPRGYAGDFETIERLWRPRNTAPADTLEHALEQYALDAAIAQQHRNKVSLQAMALVDCLRRLEGQRRPRLLSIACGSCPDVRSVVTTLAPRPFELVLLDQDRDALAFATRELPQLADRTTIVTANVLSGLRQLRALGSFDAIVMGGLLDYLDDRQAAVLLAQTTRLLADGGELLVTNIATHNPFRTWMEYCASWSLIERSESQLHDMLVAAAGSRENASVSIEREPTGLALIGRLRAC